jgi:hypothetical protein
MTSFNKTLLGAAVAASALAGSWISASAAIVCTGNVCWHTQENYAYPGEARVIVHPDDWTWGPSERYVWREHEGQGYWRDDEWREW